jgi:hypothetical protein
MTSFERLVASDPQRGERYEPRDFDALFARVVSVPIAHVTTWRAFKARVLAAVGASGAVMAVAISLIAGAGPSLAPLTFAAAPLAHRAVAPTKMSTLTVTSAGVASFPTRFVASGLSDETPSLAAFSVSAPADGARTLSLVARALAVRVGPVTAARARAAGGSSWSVRGEALSSTTLERVGGVDYWSYSFPANTLVAGGTFGPSRASLEQRALAIISQLGAMETGVPVFTTGLTSRVVVPILIAGQVTNLADTFTFDANGHVVAANGVIFSLGPPISYPLVSPRAAVVQVARQTSLFAHAVTSQGWVGYAPLGAQGAQGALGGGGVVHLTSSSLQYRVVVDAHNTAHAIPTYLFSGTSTHVVVEAAAIDPHYITYQVHGSAVP